MVYHADVSYMNTYYVIVTTNTDNILEYYGLLKINEKIFQNVEEICLIQQSENVCLKIILKRSLNSLSSVHLTSRIKNNLHKLI